MRLCGAFRPDGGAMRVAGTFPGVRDGGGIDRRGEATATGCARGEAARAAGRDVGAFVYAGVVVGDVAFARCWA